MSRSDEAPQPDAVQDFLRRLGRRVRILRLTAELTQAELAQRSGMSRSFISLVEHGSHGVDVVRLLRIATALNVPLSELIATVEDRTNRAAHNVSASSA